jgi:hypothetical protein
MKKILIVLILFQSCIGAGDMFASRDKIIGNYYLIEEESGGFSIGFKLTEGYVGRSPSQSTVVAYAIKDSLLIMHVQYYDSTDNFYIVNMNNDRDYAKEEEYHVETIATKDFKSSWIGRQNLSFKHMEE